MKLISVCYKALRKLRMNMIQPLYTPLARLQFFLNGVEAMQGLDVNGIMKVHVTRRGRVRIGKNFAVNSGDNHNIIGRQQKSILWVEGELSIGNSTGMSATALICLHKITIGNNVIIGGNTVIYDTDFHSLNPEFRLNKELDRTHKKNGAVTIEDNVFIGAHTTILKGVTIGENSVVGACSLVSKSIPKNQLWGGNPAVYIRDIV